MSHRLKFSWITFAAGIAAVLWAPIIIGAQGPASPGVTKATKVTEHNGGVKKSLANSQTRTVPNTPDGHPDLEGIWSNATLTPLERPPELAGKEFLTDEEAAAFAKEAIHRNDADRRDGDPEDDVARAYNNLWYDRGTKVVGTHRTSLIVDPPDGRIPPLTPEAQKRRAEMAEARGARGPADSYEDRNNGERCLTRGAPKLPSAYNNNFQIVQSRDYVAILQEMIHEVRMIRLDGRPHLNKNIHEWLGDSRGHWEGNTLVVDTTNYKDQIMFNNINCCGGAGANLHVIERFTRVSADAIDYQYTVDDPTTFTRPWTVQVPMTRVSEQLYEYDCHEGNYAMSNLLQGARAEEKAAKEGLTTRSNKSTK